MERAELAEKDLGVREPLREIVLDVETTGLSVENGDRIVELAALELIDRLPSGREWQSYVNPEREVGYQATQVHGLTTEKLRGQPLFASVADSFLDFIGTKTPLVIHNKEFDLGFLNFELSKSRRKPLDRSRKVVDTLDVARRKLPGQRATLDALCIRFGIDLDSRKRGHGAQIDCRLLARVYRALCDLGVHTDLLLEIAPKVRCMKAEKYPRRTHRSLTMEEVQAHRDMLKKLHEPIWKQGET